MAQTSPTSPPAGSPGAGGTTSQAPAPAPKEPAPNPLMMEDVSKLKGTDVYGNDDKKIGDVSTALMKPDSRTIDRLVVSAGGVVGIGAHHVALPIDEFKWDADKGAFRIAKSADDLKSMPEWKAATTETGSSAPAASSSPPAPTGTGSTGSGATAPAGTSEAPKQ
jgi:hypothetical protein